LLTCDAMLHERKYPNGFCLPTVTQVAPTRELVELIYGSYAHFDKGHSGVGLNMIRRAQAIQVRAVIPEAAKHVSKDAREELVAARKITSALRSIRHIRQKYPQDELTGVGVLRPKKSDCLKLYHSHNDVASYFPAMFRHFGVWLQGCPPAYAHYLEARRLEHNNLEEKNKKYKEKMKKGTS